MRLAILTIAIFAAVVSARADAISVTSPDHAQTFAYGEMVSHRVYLDRTSGELAVQVTFSNQPYADSNDPPRYESFDFRFPGVRCDSARRAFFVNSSHGEPIPVARFGEGVAAGRIDLAPGAKMYLVKDSGRITATMTATNYQRGGTRWIQADNNLSLQNVLIALFGPFLPTADN